MKALDTNMVWQIGVIVKDAEAASKRIADLFGFDEPAVIGHLGPKQYDKCDTHYDGKPVDPAAYVCFYDFGTVQIEFIQPYGDEPSTWMDFYKKHGEGIHHIAWKVADTDKTGEFLESKGIKLIQRGNWQTGTYAYYDAIDFMGVILETLEFDGERKAGKPLCEDWTKREADK